MRLERYRAEHLERMDLQEGQRYLGSYLTAELRKSLEGEFSFTVVDGETVVCCAGLVEQWQGRATAWAYLLADIGPQRFTALHKMVKRFLDVCPFERVEATVDLEFEPGHRWVKALGFQLEASVMRKYRPGGGDSALYARVR